MKQAFLFMAATALLLCSCTKHYNTLNISGEIKNDSIANVKIFVNSLGETPQEVPLSADGKSYNYTLSSETSYISNFIATYTDGNDNKMQIYIPLYVSPKQGSIKIDITERNGNAIFTTEDKDNSLLAAYYQDFYGTHMRQKPSTDEEILKFVSRISEYADSLSKQAESDEMKGYFVLRGYFDRLNAISLINFWLRGSDKKIPEAVTEGMPDVKDIVNNPAVKLFPSEVSSLIMKEIATGDRVTERIANLKAAVTDTTIISMVSDNIISRFVSTYDFSEGVETGFAILDSVAADHPNYENWKNQLQLRSSSIIGAPAPDVEIIDSEGNTHKLAEFKGKYIYVDFWASWCVPCNREIPIMKELEKTLGNDNVVFVGISIDESENDWKEALKRHELKENQFLGNRLLAEMLSIQSIPRYIIYDKEGKLMNSNAPRPSSGDEIRDILKNLK